MRLLLAEKSADTQSVDASDLETKLDITFETTSKQTRSNEKTGEELQVKFSGDFC
jgi:hypothetical protein